MNYKSTTTTDMPEETTLTNKRTDKNKHTKNDQDTNPQITSIRNMQKLQAHTPNK